MSNAPQPSWFSRNLKWLIPLGCLLPVLVCAGLVTMSFSLFSGMMRQAEPYHEAVRQAEANATITELLGTPIKQGWVVTGTLQMQNADGHAKLQIPLYGPKGRGTLHVEADRKAGRWTYSQMEMAIDGRAEPVNLLPGPAMTRPASTQPTL